MTVIIGGIFCEACFEMLAFISYRGIETEQRLEGIGQYHT